MQSRQRQSWVTHPCGSNIHTVLDRFPRPSSKVFCRHVFAPAIAVEQRRSAQREYLSMEFMRQPASSPSRQRVGEIPLDAHRYGSCRRPSACRARQPDHGDSLAEVKVTDALMAGDMHRCFLAGVCDTGRCSDDRGTVAIQREPKPRKGLGPPMPLLAETEGFEPSIQVLARMLP